MFEQLEVLKAVKPPKDRQTYSRLQAKRCLNALTTFNIFNALVVLHIAPLNGSRVEKVEYLRCLRC